MMLVHLALQTPALAAPAIESEPEYVVDRWRVNDGLPLDHVTDLVVAPDGFLWVATLDGLAWFDGARFEVLRRSTYLDFPSNHFVDLEIDDDGALWALFKEGELLQHVGGETTVWPKDALPGGAHALTASTVPEPAGPWLATGPTLFRDHLPLATAEAPIVALAPSADGVWFGTAGAGLYHLRARLVDAIPTLDPDQRSVRSVLVDRAGTLWVGLDGGGLEHHAEDGPIAISRSGLARSTIPTLVEDADGVIWAGDGDTICRVEGTHCAPVDAPGALRGVRSLAADATGLWVGTQDSLWRFESGRWRRALEGLAPIASMASNGDDGLLLATHGDGVIHWDGEERERWNRSSGLSSDRVCAVHLDGAGALWIATEDAGLCRVEPGGSKPPVCLDQDDGLFDDALHAVVEDDQGRFWISTNRGIFWVRQEALEAFADGLLPAVQSVGLTDKDGMEHRGANGGSWPSAARALDGSIYFATQDGVAMVRPSTIEPPSPLPAGLREVRVRGVPRPFLAGMELSPAERNVEFEWTAPEFRWPDQVRFRYRLRGYDDAWHGPTRDHTAAWTNLPPGDYTFEVQAGLGGAWSPQAALLAFRRAPAFHERRAFTVLVALGGMIASGLLAAFVIAGQRRRQWQLEQEVSRRTAELAATNASLEEQATRLRGQASTLDTQAHELREKNHAIQAQTARLTELDALRKRLIADLSHELRTPLTLIAGPLRDLADSELELDPQGQDRLELILRNADRLQELVDQLLDITRLEEGRMPFRVRRIRLERFVERVAGRFRSLPEADARTLLVRVPEHPVVVFCDPELIDKVLTNLLSNAHKFTPAAGTIALGLTPGAEGFVRVSVCDTGSGVDDADKARVFERFFRAEGGDTSRHAGVGIGLALCRDLVELHGGEIEVSDTPGGGATFSFTLPLGADHLGPEDIELEFDDDSLSEGLTLACLSQSVEDRGEGPLVVVVEDNPEMRAYLTEHLAQRFRVRPAQDATEGLRLCEDERPAVVVSDVMMPEIDGLEMARRLRQTPSLADVPIVLVSAKAAEEDRLAGLEVADDYLTKPLRMRELLARVARLAARSAPEPAPEEPADALAEVDRVFLETLEAAVDAELTNPALSVELLARQMGLGRRQLLRTVRRLTGSTPTDYVRERRMVEAREMLQRGVFATVAEVAAAVGLSTAYFSRLYARWYGHPPSEEVKR